MEEPKLNKADRGELRKMLLHTLYGAAPNFLSAEVLIRRLRTDHIKVSVSELLSAAQYLIDKTLVVGDKGSVHHSSCFRILANGVDCIETENWVD